MQSLKASLCGLSVWASCASSQHGGLRAIRPLAWWLSALFQFTRWKLHLCLWFSLWNHAISLPWHFIGYKWGTDIPRSKGRRTRLHHLVGGWQDSRRINGIKVIDASIFGNIQSSTSPFIEFQTWGMNVPHWSRYDSPNPKMLYAVSSTYMNQDAQENGKAHPLKNNQGN